MAAACGTTAESARLARIDASKPCVVSKLGAIPVRLTDTRAIVPVSINGVQGEGFIDTGSVATLVSSGFANRAVPSWKQHGGMIGLSGLSGAAVLLWINVKNIQVGDLTWGGGARVAVMKFSDKKAGNFAIIGRDLLDRHDFDIDLEHNAMTAYATANCVHPEPPWTTKYSGLALTRTDQDRNVTIPVVLSWRYGGRGYRYRGADDDHVQSRRLARWRDRGGTREG